MVTLSGGPLGGTEIESPSMDGNVLEMDGLIYRVDGERAVYCGLAGQDFGSEVGLQRG